MLDTDLNNQKQKSCWH